VVVANTGRVLVEVDAAFGPIHVGDLLVSNPTPGYAMRSTPVELGGIQLRRPGSVLGKALQPLLTGQEKILVFLTLS